MGGTMRLGADPVKLHEGTRAREIFGEAVIYKRHRHRYEVNNQLRRRLEDEGLVCGGTSPDERLVEMVELPDHPFFVASQFHPEFNSRPNRPEPLFREFVGAAARHAGERPADGGEIEAAEDASRRRRRRPPLRLSVRTVRLACPAVESRLHETLRPALRDPQPDRGGARGRRHDRRRAAGAGARGERGRRRRAGRSRRRQPARALCRDAATSGLMFCAHIDTVPHRGQVEVVDDEGVFRSRGETILGADNKAAVAVFMELVARHVERPPPVGIELVLTVAEEQGLRGAKAFDASQLRSRARLRPRPRRRGRRGDRHDADPAEDPRRLHRGRGARRDPARGRQQRDRRRRGGDRADGAGPARRGDDRQRRPDRGRHLGQRRPRPLRDPRRGAQPRRRAARPRSPARSPTPAPGARASTAATSTCGSKSSSAATRCRRTRRRWRWPRRGCAAPGSSRSGSRSAAAATPTSSAATASTASCSPTAPRRVHTADERVPARSLDKMLEVCERIVAAAAARGSERPPEAAPRRRRLGRPADGRGRRRAPRAPGPTRCCWARCARATRSSSTSPRSTSGSAPAASTSSTSTSPAASRAAGRRATTHVMKLNYTSLQHPVEPVERQLRGYRTDAEATEQDRTRRCRCSSCRCTGTWRRRPGRRRRRRRACGSATCRRAAARCPARSRRDVAQLRERGLLAATSPPPRPTAASTRRSAPSAPSTPPPATRLGRGPRRARARDHRLRHRLRPRRHGGPRQRPRRPRPGPADPALPPPLRADPRERHRGLSHHTRTVLELLLAAGGRRRPRRTSPRSPTAPRRGRRRRHHLRDAPADLDGYAASGLPTHAPWAAPSRRTPSSSRRRRWPPRAGSRAPPRNRACRRC